MHSVSKVYRRFIPSVFSVAISVAVLLGGCTNKKIRENQGVVKNEMIPRLRDQIRKDLESSMVGVRRGAERLTGLLPSKDSIDTNGWAPHAGRIRQALLRLRQPQGGISEIWQSGMTFVAFVDASGTVVARDQQPDQMAGFDAGERFIGLKSALERGTELVQVVDFPGRTATEPVAPTLVFAKPIFKDGVVLGALFGGTPYPALANRLKRTLALERLPDVQAGRAMWVYLARGPGIYHHDTPPELDALIPNQHAQDLGLREHGGGFTGRLQNQSYYYGYGIVPVPVLDDTTRLIVLRGE